MKAKLVISHASGDEGHDYEHRVIEYSKLMNVNTHFVSDIINEQKGYTKTGKKIYTLNDIHPHADLVTYPSDYEGFWQCLFGSDIFPQTCNGKQLFIFS